MEREDWAGLMAPVVKELLGEPNRSFSTKTELRYGKRGSISVDLEKGTWFDFETNEGGGVAALIERTAGGDADVWLRERGYINGNGRDYDRRDDRREKSKRAIDKIFDYRDGDGTLLFQVVRYLPKDFRQRRPDASARDGWNWSTRGVKQVPYQLPRLEAEALGRAVVVIVEGEKCVDRLWSLGIPATCNAGGAGKWSDELNQYFSGTDVVIIPDYDPQKRNPKTDELMFTDDGRPVLAGQDHAMAVGAALKGIAESVKVLDLGRIWDRIPPKADIYDWFEAGGDPQTFWAWIEQAAEPWAPTLELRYPDAPEPLKITTTPYVLPAPENIPPRQWLYGYHYMRGVVTATVAPGGFGKTTLALYEAMTMVVQRGLRVWYISGEDDKVEIDRRIAAHCQEYGVNAEQIGDRLFVDDKLSFPLKIAKHNRNGIEFDKASLALFQQTIKELKIDVVILDPFVSFHLLSENDTAAMDALVKYLAAICVAQNCCIELSHHVRKPGFGQYEITVYDARGAAAIVNAVRSCRVLNQMSFEEAQAVQKLEARASYMRIDSGKRNMAPPEAATWKELVSVTIANTDRVQALRNYNFAPIAATKTDEDWLEQTLAAKSYRADKRSPEWLGYAVALRFDRDADDRGDATWIKKQIQKWEKGTGTTTGRPLLRKVQGYDASRKPKQFYEWINNE